MRREKETTLAPRNVFGGEPFSMLRRMTSELDRIFDESLWSSFGLPQPQAMLAPEPQPWMPRIEMFEREHHLITRIDLPGMKKEDVDIEVTDGQLMISGERKRTSEAKEENFYRCEREYGSFYRAVPLPDGVKLEDVKATFADGVLEVSVPMPKRAEAKNRKVQITTPEKHAKVGV